MKVRITDLPPEGLTVHESLPVEPLNKRMREGKLGSDITFVTAPKAVLIVKPVATGAEAHGEVTATISQICGRCVELKERELTAVVGYSLTHKEPTDEEFEESPLGFIKVEDGHVDFDEDLYQALILEIDLFWKPDESNGKCNLCLKTFDEFRQEISPKRTMGALLEQAMKKTKK